ncbi:hypothetical protein DACRYDRAFT_15676 [Dacryopinax primogenitus]|uniref:Uncharacterized protein n=1 Tax=Dacryopinax primogenitus (strain DJM 731) TaxID=1858805 RepID=M5GDH6_DACPD|nr:uncharacterized protein DACRYDRAFT_15676 [Dacryopinax primogenitus]EJU02403.1 hypothetical protein DACRYDRAFT_15676 [Dacryopinax primogenitus]
MSPSDKFKKAMGEDWVKEAGHRIDYKITGDKTGKKEIIVAAQAMFKIRQKLLAKVKQIGIQEMEDDETFTEYGRNWIPSADVIHDKAVKQLSHTLHMGVWISKIDWEHLRMDD